MSHVDPAQARQRRIARPWRVLFIVYAVAMTTGTHWPRLDLSVGEIRAPDKILHMLAFGGLAFLLSRTRWIRSKWMLLFVMLVWAMLDEITQAIPILGRTFSWLDVSAGALGITLVMLWLWVLSPLGGELNRLRQRFAEYVLDEMTLRPLAWLLVGAAGLLMAGATGTAAGLILWWRHPDGMYTAAVAGAIAGSIAGAHGMIDALWRRERMKIDPTKPCLACGHPLGNAAVNESGVGRCPACGESFHLLQWSMRAGLSSAASRSLSFKAVSVAALLAVGSAVGYAIVWAAWTYLPMGMRGLVLESRIPNDLRLVIDLFAVGTIIALAARVYRVGVARIVDGQAETCRACGHDVHATGTERSVGICGECGVPFVRAGTSARQQVNKSTSQQGSSR